MRKARRAGRGAARGRPATMGASIATPPRMPRGPVRPGAPPPELPAVMDTGAPTGPLPLGPPPMPRNPGPARRRAQAY
jgi:hypothetical protein